MRMQNKSPSQGDLELITNKRAGAQASPFWQERRLFAEKFLQLT